MSERVVLVGSSVAGVRTAQDLRSGGFDGEIVMLGAERELPYDKPPLSKQVLVGTMSEDDIGLLGAGGWDGLGVDGRLGQRATALDVDERLVAVEGGDDVEYDALVIATGVRPRTLPGGLGDHQSVFTVRELRDGRELSRALAHGGPLMVVGAGFIGAEVASSARSLGVEVTMAEALAAPFDRVLGTEVGRHLTELHRSHGVDVLTEASVAAIEPTRDGAVVRFADGRSREAATVVVGIGTIPNTEWLVSSGIPLEDGVLVDEGCAVQAAEGVYAVGDVARRWDPATDVYRRVEHWTSAVEQAHAVAQQIIHPLAPAEAAKAPYFWSDQFGTKIQMVGRPGDADRVDLHTFEVKGVDRTVALYSSAGAFAAGVTFGWPRGIAACRAAWASRPPVADVERTLHTLSSGMAPVA
ncbi:MAG: FAD-dependent oxidoreductase [Nocardioides sp.]|nr:FAD-dependent oxidoreductase [Nocardioides sp.]